MTIFGLEFLSRLSFPDFKITDIQFNLEKKTMIIQVDGAWLENRNVPGRLLGTGKLNFMNWQLFEMYKYNNILNNWVKLSFENFEPLKDICEFQYLDEVVFLRGFGKKTGQWLEFRINNPSVECEFEDVPPYSV